MKNYNGYQLHFIDGIPVDLPGLHRTQQDDVVLVNGNNQLDYFNYSLTLSESRKFPYFTASNIDGGMFKKVPRVDNWRKDPRIAKDNQWGNELYGAARSDFDRGHMVKREDVQWGRSISVARAGADSTFFYPNAVPQHASLNQKIWKSLEDYILHTETIDSGLKINVFTGPVLSNKDPRFVTAIAGQHVRIPTLFWKIIYFPKSDGQLYRAGFLMSQESLLRENNIVESFRNPLLESMEEEDQLFNQFDEAETYQVNVATIEKLSKLTFQDGIETYKDKRPLKLVLREIDVMESLLESANPESILGFSLNIVV